MTEEKYGKFIAVTALKTILFVVGFLCLVLSYIFMIKPNTLANSYNKLGMGRAEIATYEAIYDKSNNNSDLYNLIQKCLEKENYEKAKAYISELTKKSDFDKFATGVNNASIEKALKNEVAFVVDLKAYLQSQLLICEYRLGNTDKAKAMAIDDLSNTDNKYQFLLGVYYDEVLTDLSMTVAQAKTHLMDIYRDEDVKILIDAKISACDYINEDDQKLKIATLYAKIKIMGYKLNLLTFIGEKVQATDVKIQLEILKEEYTNLTK